MSDPWTQADAGTTYDDKTVIRYHQSTGEGDDAILSIAPFDGALFSYDVTKSLLQLKLPDGMALVFDAVAHTFMITANGATIGIDASGNLVLTAAGDIGLITNAVTSSVNTQHTDLDGHVHSGVQSGSSNTGPPTVPIP